MEGRSPEFSAPIAEKVTSPQEGEEKIDPTDDGFSEAKSAKAIEGKGMDQKQGKKRKPVIGVSRIIRSVRQTGPARQRIGGPIAPATFELSQKERIVKAYKENAEALLALVEQLKSIDGSNLRQEEHTLSEIREKKHLQEELLHALVLEQKQQLTEDAISKEAWNLIK